MGFYGNERSTFCGQSICEMFINNFVVFVPHAFTEKYVIIIKELRITQI